MTYTNNYPYGDRERAELAHMADQVNNINPLAAKMLGPQLADKLREELPGLDAVTIGRVVTALAFSSVHVISPDDPVRWVTLAAAGLRLTESEWKTQHNG